MTEARTEWTVDDVAARFAEAAETADKLPRVRPGGYFNPWMTLAMQVPERYPDPERLYRPMPPSPQAVERMLETMRWVQWLEVEQRHLSPNLIRQSGSDCCCHFWEDLKNDNSGHWRCRLHW